jgi:polyisoprenoid-binding protein YceI
MRVKRTALFALLVMAALAAAPALAAVEKYTIDPAHSQVGFKIRHFVSKVPGRFGKFSGTIALDPASLASASVAVEIDPASINTDIADRDKHLRSADFFDVEKFPKMSFESTEVVPKGPNKALLRGNLTMHGVTKPVELEVDVLGYSPDSWGGYRGGFEAHGTINRKEFGIVWNKVLDAGGLMLGEEVEIILNIEAVREKPEGAAKP